MNLNDKIVKIIDGLNLSNTKFADNIDVSRPTISHIISGRNKPSIDVIQKIMIKYPQLGYNWFLDNEVLNEEKLSEIADSELIESPNEAIDTPLESRKNLQMTDSTDKSIIKSASQHSTSETPVANQRKVEKIIIFYSDGSMEVMSGAVVM